MDNTCSQGLAVNTATISEKRRAKASRGDCVFGARPVWAPAKVPRALACVIPKSDPAFHPSPWLERLPDEVLLIICSHLDIHTLGRMECWNKAWQSWVVEPYHERYVAAQEEQAARRREIDAQWAEGLNVNLYNRPIMVGRCIMS